MRVKVFDNRITRECPRAAHLRSFNEFCIDKFVRVPLAQDLPALVNRAVGVDVAAAHK